MDISWFVLSAEKEKSSYIFHIPCRSGYNDALDSAVKCVIAAFRALRVPDVSRSALRLYTSALKYLQLALDDPTRSLQAETLCATELLCIFEYLSKDIDNAWVQHARGAVRLIEHRGPGRFKTEFEKSLLVGQLGIIVTEALFEGRRCFLEDAEWISTLRSTILPNHQLSDRSELAISLFECVIPIASLMQSCSILIMDLNEVNMEQHQYLLRRIDTARNNLLRWYRQWGRTLPPLDADETHITCQGSLMKKTLSRWMTLFMSYQVCLMVCHRLKVALDRKQASLFEPQAQEIATSIIRLRDRAQIHLRDSNIMVSLIAARAVLTTAEEWNGSYSSDRAGHGTLNTIEPGKFYRWTNLMGIHLQCDRRSNSDEGLEDT
ncbi:hypothetical protein BBP40_005177 [Aspergillus hancockii]|nr:hypothetical protein BBP40_005177 [Aspergillus hancockii]